MNPNSVAFSLILRQREEQAQGGLSGNGGANWRPPPPAQQFVPQQPLQSMHRPPPPQPFLSPAAQFAPPLPTYPYAPQPAVMFPTQPQSYMATPQPPQYPSFFHSVQQNFGYSHQAQGGMGQPYSVPPIGGPGRSFGHGRPPKMQKFSAPPMVEESGQWYCEPCDKEFTQLAAFEGHKATHETCRHPGCTFSATKKVVMAHYHGTHGQFSGTGYKMIEVEGQKFRVLMGQSPEEIAQWRADRRKRFPTAAVEEEKKKRKEALAAAGGVEPRGPVGKMGRKESQNGSSSAVSVGQKRTLPAGHDEEGGGEGGTAEGAAAADGAEGSARGTGKRRCIHWGRGKCKAGDACTFSHDFEPRLCEPFLRGHCKNGFKCYNVHDLAKRAERRAQAAAGGSSCSAHTGDQKDSGNKHSESATGLAESADSGREKKRLKRGELHLPEPLQGGVLLRRLLEDEISREENVVLQCLRFLASNNFLQDA